MRLLSIQAHGNAGHLERNPACARQDHWNEPARSRLLNPCLGREWRTSCQRRVGRPRQGNDQNRRAEVRPVVQSIVTAKSISAVGLVGLAFISLILLSSRKDSQTTALIPNENVPQNLSSAPVSISKTNEPVSISKRNPDPNHSTASAPALKPASVEEGVAQLEGLGAHNDPEAFQAIVTELSNSNPEIRKAARDAIMQFGSREAIPILKDLAEKTDEAREKVALLDTIEFLALPSLSELRQQQRTNSAQARSAISK